MLDPTTEGGLPHDGDLPHIDERIAQQPEDLRKDLAELGKSDLFFFAQGVLGYKDMTVGCHGPLCSFIQSNTAQFKMMLMPRDHFKTSVVTIAGNMQKAVRDSERRILIANESATNAERFLRAIRQHAENNKIFRALYGKSIPKDVRKARWNDQELDFAREGSYPEPTFDTIGMTGASTSRHFTDICIDDPISEEAVKSDKVMQDTINRLSSFTDLLVKPKDDQIWLVGTRWAYWDVYSWFLKTFGSQVGQFVRSVVEDGEIIFPELISPEILALKRQALGEYRFSCTQMNNPRNADAQDLNVADLRWWKWLGDDAVELVDEQGKQLRVVRLDQMDITVTFDPAPAETITSDRNAIVTCGITPWDEVVVLDVFAKRCTPLEAMEHLFWLRQRFAPRAFGIEGVAYQKAFKYFLKAECDRRGVWMRVEELKAQGKKEVRIRGLQPVMATHRLYILPTQHQLRNEMSEFPLGEHDDALDALSMQLQLWRKQMSPERWQKLEQEAGKLTQVSISGHLYEHELRKQLDLDSDEPFDGEFFRYTGPKRKVL